MINLIIINRPSIKLSSEPNSYIVPIGTTKFRSQISSVQNCAMIIDALLWASSNIGLDRLVLLSYIWITFFVRVDSDNPNTVIQY